MFSLYKFAADPSRNGSTLNPNIPAQPGGPIMNPANLPFDSETMLQGLRAWV